MRHHRDDIVECAVRVLDDYGLSSLTMRRLGSELGLQASAIYHHFPSKQALLAAVADEVLARGRRPRTAGAWDGLLVEACHELRDAMLAYRDGADLVATVYAMGLGAQGPLILEAFTRHTRDLSDRFGAALRSLDCDVRIALTHYAPVPETLLGERLEI